MAALEDLKKQNEALQASVASVQSTANGVKKTPAKLGPSAAGSAAKPRTPIGTKKAVPAASSASKTGASTSTGPKKLGGTPAGTAGAASPAAATRTPLGTKKAVPPTKTPASPTATQASAAANTGATRTPIGTKKPVPKKLGSSVAPKTTAGSSAPAVKSPAGGQTATLPVLPKATPTTAGAPPLSPSANQAVKKVPVKRTAVKPAAQNQQQLGRIGKATAPVTGTANKAVSGVTGGAEYATGTAIGGANAVVGGATGTLGKGVSRKRANPNPNPIPNNALMDPSAMVASLPAMMLSMFLRDKRPEDLAAMIPREAAAMIPPDVAQYLPKEVVALLQRRR